MTYDDMPLFLDKLSELAYLYNYEWLTPRMVDRYWKSLKRFDLEAILAAVEAYQQQEDDSEKMPMPSDIKCYLSGSLNQKAITAWKKVLTAKEYLSPRNSLVFDDVVIHMVIHDLGGWIKFSQALPFSLEMLASEFKKRYLVFSLQPIKKYPCMLVGINEEIAQTYQIKLPILIGDAGKARHVYLNGQKPKASEQPFELPEAVREFVFPSGSGLK